MDIKAMDMQEIGGVILDIARHNDDFICTECLRTAYKLFRIMAMCAETESCNLVKNKFKEITGRDIEDC